MLRGDTRRTTEIQGEKRDVTQSYAEDHRGSRRKNGEKAFLCATQRFSANLRVTKRKSLRNSVVLSESPRS
jgi:hypothetical protein